MTNQPYFHVDATHDVDEAVFLADRIFMFSARPATIVEEITVADHLPGERTMSSKESEAFFHLRNRVRDLMRSQVGMTERKPDRTPHRPREAPGS